MTSKVNIDFEKMSLVFHKYVLAKALKAGSTIVYLKDGVLVEEDPKNEGHLKKVAATR